MNKNVMVVTPVFCTESNGRLPMLKETIYWVGQQTFRNFLHVLVDDGSTDNTPEFLDELAYNNPNIIVVHKESSGVSAAINYGVEQGVRVYSAGFVTVIGSDDLLLPKSLAYRVGVGENADFVYTDAIWFYENGTAPKYVVARDFKNPEAFYHQLLNRQHIPYSTIFMKLSFFVDQLGGFDDELTSSEDWDLSIRAAKALFESGGSHAVVHEPTAAVRIHPGNNRLQNIRDGTKLRCNKKILSKHFIGDELEEKIAEQEALIAKVLQGTVQPSNFSLKPYDGPFIDMARSIDYNKLLP